MTGRTTQIVNNANYGKTNPLLSQARDNETYAERRGGNN